MAQGGLGGAQPWRQDYRYSTETVCKNCGFGPTNPEKNVRPSIKSAFIVGDLDTSQKCAGRIQTTSIVTRLRSNT